MEKIDYRTLLGQGNNEQLLFLISCIKMLYHDLSVRWFLTGSAETNKTFTLKLIIQDLLGLWHKSTFPNFPNDKAFRITSVNVVTFNIDGLIIH